MEPLHNLDQSSLGLNRQGALWRVKAPVIKPRQILVPIKFSDCSYKARRHALGDTTQSRAGVILLHVIELYPIDNVVGLKATMGANSYLAELAQSRLAQSLKRCAVADQDQVGAGQTRACGPCRKASAWPPRP